MQKYLMNESETSKNLTPFLDCLMDKESRSMILVGNFHFGDFDF